MKNYNIAIIGLGTVGQGLVELIQQNTTRYSLAANTKINIVAVSAGSKDKKRDVDISDYKWLNNPLDATSLDDINGVVELVGGDSGLAYDLAVKTLSTGIDFITANKALIAKHGLKLATLAEDNNCELKFEAAVAGGIPIIRVLKDAVSGNSINKVTGILNGTCNYILSLMESENASFADALDKAQKLGYAEADPTFDIDGIDAAHKTIILNSVAFGLTPENSQIYIEGIRDINPQDIKYAAELGYKIRLVGEAVKHENSTYSQAVYKCLFTLDHPIAAINGATNAVNVQALPLEDTTYIGQGAGRGPTASSVIADILDLAKGYKSYPYGVPCNALETGQYTDYSQTISKYYLRINVSENTGVLAKITNILSQKDVSIDVLHQPEHGDKAEIVIITNMASLANMQKALTEIENLSEILNKATLIRVN